MAPADTLEGVNVCAMAEAAERQGGLPVHCWSWQDEQCSKLVKSSARQCYGVDDRQGFGRNIAARYPQVCQLLPEKRGIQPCVRLNGTSDDHVGEVSRIWKQSFRLYNFYDYSSRCTFVAYKDCAATLITLHCLYSGSQS